MQNSELQMQENSDGGTLRDQFMAENVLWILQQEQLNGHESIFVTGHNSHVAKWGSYDSMGKLLSKEAPTATMSLEPIFIRPIVICRLARLKSVQRRYFILMTL